MGNPKKVRISAWVMGAAVWVTAAGCGAAGGQDVDELVESADAVPLYDNLGAHALEISTAHPEAQAYFNQGLRLQYAFNHLEAVRSYEAALDADPACAMCWWGIALALGPNVNAAMETEAGARAFAAAGRARERLEGTTPLEHALVEALSERYGRDPEADRTALDSAYSRAMNQVVSGFPDHPDVLTLYAASMMNLRPWDYWSGTYGDRHPNPGTEELLGALERALNLDPNNPGACHYYIHAVEAAFPERAEACAERLAGLMPGAGHIVHMPGHIYIRIGRYADAVRANEHAVHSDETYIADQNPMGVYPAAYYPHNYHFMAFAATMAGMSGQAMRASEIVSPKVPKSVALEVYWIQNAVVLPQLTALSFGRWDDVLTAPMPDPDLDQATVMALYARGTALAALGRMDEAREAEAALRDRVATADPEGSNPVLTIAGHTLSGEMALRSGQAQDAVRHFQAAVSIEDEMLYEEPPLWYYPIRQSLGPGAPRSRPGLRSGGGVPSRSTALPRKRVVALRTRDQPGSPREDGPGRVGALRGGVARGGRGAGRLPVLTEVAHRVPPYFRGDPPSTAGAWSPPGTQPK